MCMSLFSFVFFLLVNKTSNVCGEGEQQSQGKPCNCFVVLLRETLRVPGRINFLFGGPVHANELRGGRCICLFTLILIIWSIYGVVKIVKLKPIVLNLVFQLTINDMDQLMCAGTRSVSYNRSISYRYLMNELMMV